MKFYHSHEIELASAVRRAYRKHKSIRVAAKSLGMPRSTFHEWMTKAKDTPLHRDRTGRAAKGTVR